jgi:2-dehydro-3-deoxyphosphogluconate aldolase/(4S)-4-hydroxy-2-oxoglutarate aldolase
VTPQAFVERFGREKASAILRTDDQEKAGQAMEAAVRGGFTIIEFTLSIPGAYELVREFSQREGLVVGTGTVMDEHQARQSVAAGARFLVSPVVDETVIAVAEDLEVAVIRRPRCSAPIAPGRNFANCSRRQQAVRPGYGRCWGQCPI